MPHHILVVEDEEPLLEGICDLLEMAGYQVDGAIDGVQALEKLRAMNGEPSLIVSDIRMPNMTGLELLDQVRGDMRWASVPFIFLTARGERGDMHDGRLRGADDYIVKPFDYRDLLVAIEARLTRQQTIRAAEETRMEALRKRILEMVHHEFRTPLSYIVAYADLLSGSESFTQSEELKQYVTGILSGSERLLRLIESFLLLAELESGQGSSILERRIRPIENPAAFFEEIIAGCEPLAAARGVRLLTRIAPELPAFSGDSNYLSAAIKHLLENAVKFSPANSDAEVRCDLMLNDGRICFVIEDQGRGIPADEQPGLFEVFYQVNRKQHEQQGIGAGLAIVKHVARLHRGEIQMQSEEGVGSIFTFSIPAGPREVK